MSTEFILMGCGNSTGVPAAGNEWGACDPGEPKNIRLRPSAAIVSETTCVVIDTGPDFRMQANLYDISRLDAVLYTHPHSDHVTGIDDLRPYAKRAKARIPVYGDSATLDDMAKRFDYVFHGSGNLYQPVVEAQEISISPENPVAEILIGDLEITAFVQDHGTCHSLGYRVGEVGYSTDMVDLGEPAVEALRGVRTWIADGAGYRFEKVLVHANIARVVSLGQRIGAEHVYLTHLTPMMDYRTLCDELPEGFAPAYDGLRFLA